VRTGKELYYGDEKFGEVVMIDQAKGVVDIKKTKKTRRCIRRPFICGVRRCRRIRRPGHSTGLATWTAENGVAVAGRYRAGRDLLLRRPPRLINGRKLQQLASETAVDTANRIVLALEDSVLRFKGLPAPGKTYTGARMIAKLGEIRETDRRGGG